MKRAFRTFVILALLCPSLSFAGQFALVGGTVYPVTADPIEGGMVLIDGEVISYVGPPRPVPEGFETIDCSGLQVYPGFIDANTGLGTVEVWAVPQTVDRIEATDPVTPQIRMIDAINPASELIPVNRIRGITSVLVAPGENNVVSGRSAVISLAGETVDDMLLEFPAAMHVNFGEPPRKSEDSGGKAPMSRMGIAALLRQNILKALGYRDRLQNYEEKKADWDAGKREKDSEEPRPPDRDLALEAWLPVLDGRVPLIARAQRSDDIITAVRIAEEFGLKLILSRAAEAWKVVDVLAEKNIPIIVGPVTTQPGRMETLGSVYENAAILHEAGIMIAIQTGNAHNVRNLPYEAGLAVAHGLPRDAAIEAITINPARILGVEDKTGSLEEGKLADVVVYDADPLQPRTHVKRLFIRGDDIPLTSFQTRVADQYR